MSSSSSSGLRTVAKCYRQAKEYWGQGLETTYKMLLEHADLIHELLLLLGGLICS